MPISQCSVLIPISAFSRTTGEDIVTPIQVRCSNPVGGWDVVIDNVDGEVYVWPVCFTHHSVTNEPPVAIESDSLVEEPIPCPDCGEWPDPIDFFCRCV